MNQAVTNTELGVKLPRPLQRLQDVAMNYWWTWTPDRLTVFRDMDPALWESCRHSPVLMLRQMSYMRLTQLATDPWYLNQVENLVRNFDSYMTQKETWAFHSMPGYDLQRPVAYFSAEYGLDESLPTYSGGLGCLAGDHLKSASDLGVPLVAVGLLYRQGYFHQRLDSNNWQTEYYENSNFEDLPVTLMRDEHGQVVTIEVPIRDRMVKVQVWRVNVGRVQLYLLDTDRADNDAVDRWITGHLYGGNIDTRISQEIVLGIGGVRMLRALGIAPAVFHMNEGHAAFLILELLREATAGGLGLQEAGDQVRQGCVFTTHTPVPAGHDTFSPDLMDTFFSKFWPQLGIDRKTFLALGAKRVDDPWDNFNMTVLALRYARASNGVSEKHGEVSREMFQVLYPGKTTEEVPIIHITNGVHARSWISPLFWEMYDRYLGTQWEEHLSDPEVRSRVDRIPDEELWWKHEALRERLIAFARHQVAQARRRRGEHEDWVNAAYANLLDPNILTIGFARRFSTYKRANLIIQDPDRALRIFSSQEFPVQLLLAGKAHPKDEEGKRLIQKIMEWARHPALVNRVAFLEDYDIHTARKLVQGVDVWLNNPRRPLEASGTSGEKVAFNGALNLSILDGWWIEGYNGKNGWAIGEEIEGHDIAAQDLHDSLSLYHLLENEVIPMFYDRDEKGLPRTWIAWMKESIKSLAPQFNTDRMVAEYVCNIYAGSCAVTAPRPVLTGAGFKADF
ncbi:alpha-glucan family phosphorylase [Candidatus Cyanaurora vandensis]|uniref:alpha-glucan family phosphorylase n=1 Tax=Candidatus Cyanaurora vandensis TaxID=2714958 RepID=UPI0025805E1A|nr:alpha-glucan family phosphorylase [Candidatus Cyanaurora vandensis]